ncbi:hypothetical protein VTI74DRAFT_2256 [Chaetomium olivicolor]
MLNLIDSMATNTSVLVTSATSDNVTGSLMLEIIIVESSVAAISSPLFPFHPLPTSPNTHYLYCVVNVKSVPSQPLSSNSTEDNSAYLQAILNLAAAEDNLVFFPHGI